MTTDQVGQKLEEALVDLCREDGFLLDNDLHKRTLCFRLAHYLVPIFKKEGYDVDCEYNRFHDPKSEDYFFKRLYEALAEEIKKKTPRNEWVSAFPDIIVHQRRNRSNNLLVIEAKRVSSEIKDRFDIAKLRAYKEALSYSFAIFLKFPSRTRKINWGFV